MRGGGKVSLISLFVLSLAGGPILACAEEAEAFEVQSEMRFQIVLGSNNGVSPRFLLIADGRITSKTPSRFEVVSRKLPPGSVVYLSSAGGSLLSAMALGVAIRRRQLHTLIPNGVSCTSACAYAFLGGAKRTVLPMSAFGLHRPFLRNRLTGEVVTDDKYFMSDDLGELVRGYATAMDVSPEIVQLGQEIDPNDMRYMDQMELKKFRITTD